MKKYILLFFLFYAYAGFAQQGSNPFAESEKSDKPVAENRTALDPGGNDSGGGNPGDSLPVDNYLPLLAVFAAALIVYKSRRKNIILK